MKYSAAKGLLAAAAMVAVAVIAINLMPGMGVADPAPPPCPRLRHLPRRRRRRRHRRRARSRSRRRRACCRRNLPPRGIEVHAAAVQHHGPGRLEARRRQLRHQGDGDRTPAFDWDGVFMAAWIVSHVYRDSCRWFTACSRPPPRQRMSSGPGEPDWTRDDRPDGVKRGRPAGDAVRALGSHRRLRCGVLRLGPDPALAGCRTERGLRATDIPGQTTTVYVVDVAGQPQMIVAVRGDGSSPADVAELNEVVGSLHDQLRPRDGGGEPAAVATAITPALRHAMPACDHRPADDRAATR